jgi:hypothetical protein
MSSASAACCGSYPIGDRAHDRLPRQVNAAPGIPDARADRAPARGARQRAGHVRPRWGSAVGSCWSARSDAGALRVRSARAAGARRSPGSGLRLLRQPRCDGLVQGVAGPIGHDIVEPRRRPRLGFVRLWTVCDPRWRAGLLGRHLEGLGACRMLLGLLGLEGLQRLERTPEFAMAAPR